ncbi:MAG TPA: hypothetical protein VN600_05165 [Gemmatimonadaceae bacterium]|nr:hypothetical protein [Gemmatimonadaceae bacterium]
MSRGCRARVLALRFAASNAVAAIALLAPGHGAFAQNARPTRCELVQQPSTRLSSDSLPGVGQVLYVGGGPLSVLIKCPERGITLRGDSAQQFADHDQMIGHATYDEPRFHVAADFLNYFHTDDRVTAAGNVHARLASGSTLDGPQAEYLHASPKIRAHDQMRAIARPTITIVERDSTGKPQPPTTVVSDSVFVDNDSLVSASANVVITRPNLSATADSAFIDQGHETMRLMKHPVLKGTTSRPFTLTGTVIDMYSKNRKLQRVLSRPNAVATSDSMTLKSDTIDLRVHDDQLDHAYAWSGGDSTHAGNRARVISPSQNLTADSLDVAMPNQHVRLVHAVRRALAESKPDTTRFKLDKPDTLNWLQGDTIVAHFDSLAAGDTTKNPPIRQLVASGHASSLYHMAPSDTSIHRPAINHVVARVITIDFDQQKVGTVTTVDSVLGVYLEPKPDSTSRKRALADTVKAKPKTKPGAAPATGAKPPTSAPSKPPSTPPAKPPAKPPAESLTPGDAQRTPERARR